MAKYSKKSQQSVKSAMKKMKKGILKSGRSEEKILKPKEARGRRNKFSIKPRPLWKIEE